MRTERFRGALLSTLAIASLITLLSLLSPSTVHAALTPHDPIYIEGNDNFIPANGVNGGGSGTVGDPYIIENYIIDASTADGIFMKNTTAYFVIRNCMVENGRGTYRGIRLDNVVNGRIENNICSNNRYSIYLYSYSSYNILDNNTCKNNYDGIYLYSYSSYNTLTNNTCRNNNYSGIHLYSHSSNNTLDNNTCENNGSGIYLYYYSDNNTIRNNTCEKNNTGIYLSISDNNLISNNTCENNNWSGFYLQNSVDNNLISNNTCENNNYGIRLEYNSNSNLIYHNNFVNNTTQAYDSCSNYWDDGYPSGGNYWSDYAGVDENHGENQDIPGSDGIGDTPYNNILGGSNQDRYPLMNPWPPIAGTAVFSLKNLYKVGLDWDLQLNTGSKLVVKFYTYVDAYENENVIENFAPPAHVEENEEARHPEGIGVKKARLDLTTDDTDNVISTIASFTVRRVDLEARFMEIPFEWSQADPAGKLELETEFMEIPFYWAQAPS